MLWNPPLDHGRLLLEAYRRHSDAARHPSTIGLEAPLSECRRGDQSGVGRSIGYNNRWGDFDFGVQANLSDVVNEIVDMKGTYGASGAIRNQEVRRSTRSSCCVSLGIIQTQEQADWINANCPQYQPGDTSG